MNPGVAATQGTACMAKILLVEDDIPLGEAVVDSLSRNYIVEFVHTGKEAADRLKLYSYDLVILDWGLPDELKGIDVCRMYRAQGGTCPILMLTGRDTIVDKETGLDCGADDYLTKPFDIRELEARVRARLRRPANLSPDEIVAGSLRLDVKQMVVTKNGETIDLIPKEYKLLEFFIKHQNELFTAEALLDRLWSSESDTSPDIIRVYVTRLRKKIDDPGHPSMISTKRNGGYMFKPITEETKSAD